MLVVKHKDKFYIEWEKMQVMIDKIFFGRIFSSHVGKDQL